MILLTVKFKDDRYRTFEFVNQKIISIGRWRNNDLVLDDPTVSGHHAKILHVRKAYYLADLNSQNGSFVNKKRVTTRLLQSGDTIYLGSSVIEYTYEDLETKFDTIESRLNPKTAVIDTRQLPRKSR